MVGKSSRPVVPPRRLVGERTEGIALVLFTACSWGLTWPQSKFLLTMLPPFSMRSLCGVLGCGFAFLVAIGAAGADVAAGGPVAAADRVLHAELRPVHRADDAVAGVAEGVGGGGDHIHPAGLGLAAGVADAGGAAERSRSWWRWCWPWPEWRCWWGRIRRRPRAEELPGVAIGIRGGDVVRAGNGDGEEEADPHAADGQRGMAGAAGDPAGGVAGGVRDARISRG